MIGTENIDNFSEWEGIKDQDNKKEPSISSKSIANLSQIYKVIYRINIIDSGQGISQEGINNLFKNY